MDDLYIMQGSSQIEILNELLSSSEMTGNIIRSEIDWSTIHVGIWRKDISLDYDLYGNIIPRSWIKNIWNFAHEYEISLPNSPTQIDIHREGDLFLMEQFSHRGFTPRQLEKLNWCQLYPQIHTLSDISNGHDKYFGKRYHDGLVPAQDVHFFYTRSHFSALQNCALLFSTNFQFIFIFKKCIT